MKRLTICIAILLSIVALSAYNIATLYHIRVELTTALDQISQKLEQQGSRAVVEDAQAFQALWLRREETLVKFIRHNDLEQITWDCARLPSLARYEETGELTAEISRIRLQVNHLWETQVPRFRTVF